MTTMGKYSSGKIRAATAAKTTTRSNSTTTDDYHRRRTTVGISVTIVALLMASKSVLSVVAEETNSIWKRCLRRLLMLSSSFYPPRLLALIQRIPQRLEDIPQRNHHPHHRCCHNSRNNSMVSQPQHKRQHFWLSRIVGVIMVCWLLVSATWLGEPSSTRRRNLWMQLIPMLVVGATASSSSSVVYHDYAGRGVYWERSTMVARRRKQQHDQLRRRRRQELQSGSDRIHTPFPFSLPSASRQDAKLFTASTSSATTAPAAATLATTTSTSTASTTPFVQLASTKTMLPTKGSTPKTTLAAMLNEKFQDGVLIRRNSNKNNIKNNKNNKKRNETGDDQDVHTMRLLKAMKQLASVQRQVGQKANANEMLKNIRKVETVYKEAPSVHRETIAALMSYEKDILQIHSPQQKNKVGILKDPSAAMGLLWLRRALEFQQQLFALVLTVPATPTPLSLSLSSTTNTIHEPPGNNKCHAKQTNGRHAPDSTRSVPLDATQASLLAYSQTLQQHHGWQMQKIYSVALRTGTPSREELLRSMGGYTTAVMSPQEEQTVIRDLQALVETWKPIVTQMKKTFAEMDLEDKRRA